MSKNGTKKKNKKGFTLLELLVVILIIGILAAVALPQYKKAVLKSRYATIKDAARVIYEAEQRYYILYDKYISDWQNLDIDNTFTDCSVLPSSYVVCTLRNAAKHPLIEYVMLFSRKRRCDAFPKDETSVTNQVCQLETGKKQADYCSDGSNYCGYYYN